MSIIPTPAYLGTRVQQSELFCVILFQTKKFIFTTYKYISNGLFRD